MKTKSKTTEPDIDINTNICAHYKRGMSLLDCACLFGRSKEGIRYILHRKGVRLRAPYITNKAKTQKRRKTA